jgi:DNA-binding LacI/PurR family transcriptional regulator
VTAVFAANDEMAAGLMRALHEAGRAVPGDVSVVGFDGIELSAQLWPPLTTVAQDFGEIGRRLVNLLLRQVRDGEDVTDAHTVVPVRLVERGSTAAPAGR